MYRLDPVKAGFVESSNTTRVDDDARSKADLWAGVVAAGAVAAAAGPIRGPKSGEIFGGNEANMLFRINNLT